MNLHLIFRMDLAQQEGEFIEKAARVLYPHMAVVGSVHDLVETCVKVCSPDRRIGTLEILGHSFWDTGFDGIYIGRDRLSTFTLPQHTGSLLRLSPLFSRNPRARVFLGGCFLGRDGVSLLRVLSLLWGGVAVMAGTAVQVPMREGIEGEVRICVG